jgi:hypothetical protein
MGDFIASKRWTESAASPGIGGFKDRIFEDAGGK